MQARSLYFDAALQDLAGLLLKLALAQAVPEALDEELPDRDRLVSLARSHDPESVQLYYQIALQGREDLVLAPDEYAGFVMTLLRMLAFRPEAGGATVADVSGSAAMTARAVAPARAAGPAKAAAPARAAASDPKGAGGNPAPVPTTAFDGDWPGLVARLPVAGAVRELARNTAITKYADGLIELVVPKSMSHLAERGYQDKLKAALERHFGRALTLKVAAGEPAGATAAALEAGERDVKRAQATQAVQGDKFVQDLVDMFDAKVIGSSIRANGDKS
jgi:DNA polymerase-3 subunit gamma/tau